MKNYIPLVSDTLFCTVAIFIVLKFLFSLFLNNALSLIFSLTLSLLLGLMFFSVLKKKKGKNLLKKAEEKKMNENLIRLSFMKKSSILTFFQRVFSKLKVENYVKNGRIYLPEHGAVIFIHFDFDEVRKSEIIKYYNLLRDDEIGVIFSQNFSSEIKEFCSNFNGKIKTYAKREIFELLGKAEIFPENDVFFFKEKERKWDFSLLLNKKRAKNYFFYGIIFMLYSFIVPIKIYYIIIGSLFLIFSLTVKLFGKTEDKKSY